jgi:hypothetical protein
LSAPAVCVGASTPLPGQSVAGTAGATGGTAPGCIGRAVTTQGAGGVQSDSTPWCTRDTDGDGVTDTGPGGADAAAPPPPPTHAEIVASVCPAPPQPAVGVSPREFGVTGVDTWFWDASAPSARSAAGSIRGYAVRCTVTPTLWVLDTGDPHAERHGRPRTGTSDQPGRDDAATPLHHLFEVTGTYRLSLQVTWQRVTTAGADAITTSAARDYVVRQVRAGMTTDATAGGGP